MLSEDLIKGAREAAKYLGISERSVYHMTEKRQLPVIRKGRTLFYRKSDLDQAFVSEPIAA
jgi:excisionase family DNA binding protein